MERRKASAPEAGGSRKRIVRGARRARGADRWRHLFVWRGYSICAFRRSASLFYLEAKHSRLSFLLQNSGANGAAKTCLLYPPLEGEGRGPKGRGVGCAAMQGFAARCARFHPIPPRFARRPSPSRGR